MSISQVTDVNDEKPRFLTSSVTELVSELSPPGTVVTTLVAEDKDSDSQLVYRILSVSHYRQDGQKVNGVQVSHQCKQEFPAHPTPSGCGLHVFFFLV